MTYLTVLGQTYDVAPSVEVVIGSKRYTADQAISFIAPGTYVSVVGTESVNGRHQAKEIVVSLVPYVPGASDVFVSGLVTSYDAATGVAQIGSLQINATAPLSANPFQAISIGSRVDVLGIQAAPGGTVWATDLKSISGTGASVKSISGTGAELQSISGTGASLRSISGTGKAIQSISGTGAGVQSILGTGAAVQSISGTGAGLRSISGTGKSVLSISGTGASVQSISGTGTEASVQSISGTGTQIE